MSCSSSAAAATEFLCREDDDVVGRRDSRDTVRRRSPAVVTRRWRGWGDGPGPNLENSSCREVVLDGAVRTAPPPVVWVAHWSGTPSPSVSGPATRACTTLPYMSSGGSWDARASSKYSGTAAADAAVSRRRRTPAVTPVPTLPVRAAENAAPVVVAHGLLPAASSLLLRGRCRRGSASAGDLTTPRGFPAGIGVHGNFAVLTPDAGRCVDRRRDDVLTRRPAARAPERLAPVPARLGLAPTTSTLGSRTAAATGSDVGRLGAAPLLSRPPASGGKLLRECTETRWRRWRRASCSRRFVRGVSVTGRSNHVGTANPSSWYVIP